MLIVLFAAVVSDQKVISSPGQSTVVPVRTLLLQPECESQPPGWEQLSGQHPPRHIYRSVCPLSAVCSHGSLTQTNLYVRQHCHPAGADSQRAVLTASAVRANIHLSTHRCSGVVAMSGELCPWCLIAQVNKKQVAFALTPPPPFFLLEPQARRIPSFVVCERHDTPVFCTPYQCAKQSTADDACRRQMPSQVHRRVANSTACATRSALCRAASDNQQVHPHGPPRNLCIRSGQRIHIQLGGGHTCCCALHCRWCRRRWCRSSSPRALMSRPPMMAANRRPRCVHTNLHHCRIPMTYARGPCGMRLLIFTCEWIWCTWCSQATVMAHLASLLCTVYLSGGNLTDMVAAVTRVASMCTLPAG